MRPKRLLTLALVTLLAAACGKAPTEVVSVQSPTPAPLLMTDVAGTWTGTMTYLTASEPVTASIAQDGPSVHVTWSSRYRGHVQFDGAFLGNRTKPYLSGALTVEKPIHCEMWPIKVSGEPTSSSMTLKGSGFWCFDPAPVSLQLLKSVPR